MATTARPAAGEPSKARERGITALTVRGYKSLYDETRLEIRPLTILAGANSSGKSSAMQPLLLLKQTLEAPYDPGSLLLDGPNVRFTAAEQFLSRVTGKRKPSSFSLELEVDSSNSLRLEFAKSDGAPIELVRMIYKGPQFGSDLGAANGGNKTDGIEITIEMLGGDQHSANTTMVTGGRLVSEATSHPNIPYSGYVRRRCFFGLRPIPPVVLLTEESDPGMYFGPFITNMLHIPGLRGNPERTYNTSAISPNYPGLFDSYVASIVHHWQSSGDAGLGRLEAALDALGLTSRVEARPVEDTRFELRVGRLPRGSRNGAKDLVSIADVGFGVSQVLPVLVALLVAEPGRLVYIEQPELHLHPRAQVALAGVLADAARRGVRVVIETHSSLLLLAVQSLVAEGKLSPDLVKLHWFQRRPNGLTEVRSADLDDAGAFGDWPEDFADVSLETQSRYLNAAESRLRAR